MKKITVDSKFVRGTNINNETVDNLLHFFVNYNFITKYDITQANSMGELHSNINLA